MTGAAHQPPPPSGGIGLKSQHFSPFLDAAARGAGPRWVEVHPQNYMIAGGPMHRWLTAVREAVPVSFHSVGLSLGDPGGVNLAELDRLASLVDRYEPALVSDHLSWSSIAGEQIPDLLPLPMTHESLAHFAEQVDIVQDRLGRRMLVENPSRMIAFSGDDFAEEEFLGELVRRTGCGLILDVNNVIVQAINIGVDALSYIDAVDGASVGEIHVAGHAIEQHGDARLAIDDHGSPVSEECWTLLERLLDRIGPRPVLVERDNAVPSFDELAAEAAHADDICRRSIANAA